MLTGTIKWFDPDKAYGFITPADLGKDVYVHAKALQKSNIETLEPGTVVTYTLSGKGEKLYAQDIVKVSPASGVPVEGNPPDTRDANGGFEVDEDFEREWGLRRA
jgi:cold shock protein